MIILNNNYKALRHENVVIIKIKNWQNVKSKTDDIYTKVYKESKWENYLPDHKNHKNKNWHWVNFTAWKILIMRSTSLKYQTKAQNKKS